MDKKYVDYKYDNTDYDSILSANNKILFVCKCGHYELFNNSISFSEWKCPHCGNVIRAKYFTLSPVDNYVRPYMARIYYNEDGSTSIGLIRKHRYACITKEGNGICRIRYSVQRFIFHRNGQTYIKNSVYTDTKRPVHPRKPRFFTATYKSEYLPYELYKLFNEDLLLKDIVLKNRFRKLDTLYDAVVNLTHVGMEEDYHYAIFPEMCRRIRNLLASIKPETTDIEAYHLLLKHSCIKGGKKLKRLFAVSPYKAFVTACAFKSLKMKDINSFYTLMDKIETPCNLVLYMVDKSALKKEGINSLPNSTKYLRFLADTIMEKYGEHSLLNFLITATETNPRIVDDTVNFITNIADIIPMDEIKTLITNNIRETHDLLMERSRMFNSHTVSNCRDIISNNEKLKTVTDYIEQKSLKISNISFIQKLINFNIEYNEKEMELEGEYNGVRFFLPKDTDTLIKVGDKMHNCVGSCYRTLALNKECIIVVMQKDEKYVGCIEISNGIIMQALAPYNNELRSEYLKAFNLWKKNHNIEAYRYGNALADKIEYTKNRINQYDKIYEAFCNSPAYINYMKQADTNPQTDSLPVFPPVGIYNPNELPF